MNGAILETQASVPILHIPAAAETIFCSATPALMNQGPIRSRKGSSAIKPRSPVKKANLCSLNRLRQALQAAFLMAPPLLGGLAHTVQNSMADNAIRGDFP